MLIADKSEPYVAVFKCIVFGQTSSFYSNVYSFRGRYCLNVQRVSVFGAIDKVCNGLSDKFTDWKNAVCTLAVCWLG